MSTPLQKAARCYTRGGFSRLHMPGHKGQNLPWLHGIAPYDLTEVTGLDSLYEADSAIAETEAAYASLYGTAASCISAGGSTLCIQAMLALAAKPGSKILVARGVHTAAINAMALLDLQPVWMLPEQDKATGLAQAVTPGTVADALAAHPDAAGVYITSPTYLGVLSDIAAIKNACRRHGVPLLVDNAHGAHLKFLSPSLHPVDLGADLCCDSLHKSLPVLTGGALLHICNQSYVAQAKSKLALFGSTSPSYPIMLSVDGALPYLQRDLAGDISRVSARLEFLWALAAEKGFARPAGPLEPLRLTLGFGAAGYTAPEFMAHLHRHQIEPEYLSGSYCVLMASGFNTAQDFDRVEQAIGTAAPRRALPLPAALPEPGMQCMSLRDAVFAQSEAVETVDATGRVAAAMVTPCPPGIPLVIPGEVLEDSTVAVLKSYGICKVHVVK